MIDRYLESLDHTNDVAPFTPHKNTINIVLSKQKEKRQQLQPRTT
jgi:hypothetical protein